MKSTLKMLQFLYIQNTRRLGCWLTFPLYIFSSYLSLITKYLEKKRKSAIAKKRYRDLRLSALRQKQKWAGVRRYTTANSSSLPIALYYG